MDITVYGVVAKFADSLFLFFCILKLVKFLEST